jgi:hypothetical protein
MRNFTDEKIFLNHGAQWTDESFPSAIFAIVQCVRKQRMTFPTPSVLRSGQSHDIEFRLMAPLTAPGNKRGMSFDDVVP